MNPENIQQPTAEARPANNIQRPMPGDATPSRPHVPTGEGEIVAASRRLASVGFGQVWGLNARMLRGNLSPLRGEGSACESEWRNCKLQMV